MFLFQSYGVRSTHTTSMLLKLMLGFLSYLYYFYTLLAAKHRQSIYFLFYTFRNTYLANFVRFPQI